MYIWYPHDVFFCVVASSLLVHSCLLCGTTTTPLTSWFFIPVRGCCWIFIFVYTKRSFFRIKSFYAPLNGMAHSSYVCHRVLVYSSTRSLQCRPTLLSSLRFFLPRTNASQVHAAVSFFRGTRYDVLAFEYWPHSETFLGLIYSVIQKHCCCGPSRLTFILGDIISAFASLNTVKSRSAMNPKPVCPFRVHNLSNVRVPRLLCHVLHFHLPRSGVLVLVHILLLTTYRVYTSHVFCVTSA